MTATDRAPRVRPAPPGTRRPVGRVVRRGAVAGVLAAAATTALAATARWAGVDLEVDATELPIPAFAWWTLVGTALGVVLACTLRRRRRFVAVASVAVALSLVPALAAPDDTATRAVLVAAHLLAAAIVVPTLARELPAVDDRR